MRSSDHLSIPLDIDELVDAELAAAPERFPGGVDVAGGAVVVVLDDDPTGTQTVRGVPVLTSWSPDDLRWAFETARPGFFILTNTRSLDAPGAALRIREIAMACEAAARRAGVVPVFVSRGDSTLRGHFPLETDVLAEATEAMGPVTGVILAPAYVDAGRVTIDGVHRVIDARGLAVPVGETEFARDATFGFTRSSLPLWVEERSGGMVPSDSVVVVSLEDLRLGGPDRVVEILRSVKNGGVVAVDAVRDDDLRVAVAAMVRLEAAGARFVVRGGPSFVRARLGQLAADPVPAELLAASGEHVAPHGLVVVGSHVALTTRQLEVLRQSRAPIEVELDVNRTEDVDHRAALVDRISAGLEDRTVVLHTTRVLRRGDDPEASLAIARAVSRAVVAVVRAAIERRRPAFLVAKGGITSSDIATEALGVHRAWVEGTMLPGIVSVWRPVDGRLPGMPYVVFAGNVGDDEALLAVVDRLDRPAGDRHIARREAAEERNDHVA